MQKPETSQIARHIHEQAIELTRASSYWKPYVVLFLYSLFGFVLHFLTDGNWAAPTAALKITLLYSLTPPGIYLIGFYFFNLVRAAIRTDISQIPSKWEGLSIVPVYESCRHGQLSPITIVWDKGHTWTTNDLRKTCEDIVDWLREKRNVHTTLDAYGTDWVLRDPDSGLDLPKPIALFRGIEPDAKVPKILRIIILAKPEKKREAWEIEGARSQKFKLYVAACLLVGDTPQWPLLTGRSREEYQALSRAIQNDELGGKLAYEWGELLEVGAGEEDVTHTLDIERRPLRKYLRSVGRAVPEFLEEQFDKEDFVD